MPQKKRCSWVNLKNPLYIAYHDKEWGKPIHDDRAHFELLTLEGAQAGLNWEVILRKREEYRQVFLAFDPKKISRFSNKKIQKILKNPGIVRNRLKIESTVSNAKAFLAIQKEFGSFDSYIWKFVGTVPIRNRLKKPQDYPTKTVLSDRISKDLKKRGFRFVGSTIIYAYLQAAGLIDAHTQSCFINNWSVYIIRCSDDSLYTGMALDVKKRFQIHCSQGAHCAKYLRGRAPLTLVYKKLIGTKNEAMCFERKVKKYTKLEKEQFIVHS